MKYKKLVLAGGNGYLGKVLCSHYRDIADEIIVLSRKPNHIDGNITTVVWDGKQEGDWVVALEGADMLINLCGKNVNCRYTAKNREEIIRSRIEPTILLGKSIRKMKNPPRLWINVTSATIYRHAEDYPQDEESGDIGYGFSVDVCKRWEEEFWMYETPGTRKIALRMGIVLGRSDGVFPRLLNLVKCGLGGKQGNGTQYVSWIHEQDAARCTEWLLEHNECSGVFNCTAPEAIQNRDFMTIIRKVSGISLGLPSPEWLLNMGAVIIGTETELILKSRWVAPNRLLNAGYSFLFNKAEHAITDILSVSL